MSEHICPWWVGYLLLIPFRRWAQDPKKILKDHVRPGMTVLEPGPGMGFFTLDLARQVGPSGRVVAVDMQPKMIAALKRRATKAGMLERLDARVAQKDSMGLTDLREKVDFTLAFYTVHEMPSAKRFFEEASAAMKPGGTLLLSEPRGHVKDEMFAEELKQAEAAGFTLTDRPSIKGSLTAVLRKRQPVAGLR